MGRLMAYMICLMGVLTVFWVVNALLILLIVVTQNKCLEMESLCESGFSNSLAATLFLQRRQ